MPPRLPRPRLLLPLVFGVLIVPAFLSSSAGPGADPDVHASTICKIVVPPPRKPGTPRDAPTCVNCRAPLLNAPLARADRAPLPTHVALPPAA